MIIVIADDLTGAAEIAGIGHTYGLSTSLITDTDSSFPVSDMIVVATDTRSMTENEAIEETHRICQYIKKALPELTLAREAAMTPLQRAQALARPSEVLHIFKKTDSVLRGHVHKELRALIEESRYEQVMYMPANPSKGRTIRGGRYFIDGNPLEQTEFKDDPEYPAVTANVAAAIGVMPGSRLRICDAENEADVARVVKLALNNKVPTMLAGAADLFCALLTELGKKPQHRRATASGLSEKGTAIIVCGSTQSTDISKKPYILRHNMTTIPLPRDVYDEIVNGTITVAKATERWMGRLKQLQLVAGKTSSFILTMPYPSTGSRSAALLLREVTAAMTKLIGSKPTPNELVIEGGATAFAIIKELGWKRFRIDQQIAPGIIRMACLDVRQAHLTLKPGSYDWDALFD